MKRIIVKVIVLAIFTLFFMACGVENNSVEQGLEITEEFTGSRYVKTHLVSAGIIERVLNYSGYVKFDQAINILPNLPGRIDVINVREGQQVVAGQLLATIDQNSLVQAEANFNLAENNFRRAQNLLEQSAIDQKSFEEIEVFYINAKASYELAKENLEITAPFAGTISQSNFKVNDNYNPMMGLALFRLISNEDIFVEVNVSDTDVRQLSLNQNVRVNVDTRIFEGFISFISPENDRMTGLNRIKVDFRTAPRELRNNQFITVEFVPESRENVLVIPRTALIGDNMVILSIDERAVYKSIVIGMESRHFVEVIDGLKEGDKVIIEGVSGLINNAPIVEFNN